MNNNPRILEYRLNHLKWQLSSLSSPGLEAYEISRYEVGNKSSPLLHAHLHSHCCYLSILSSCDGFSSIFLYRHTHVRVSTSYRWLPSVDVGGAYYYYGPLLLPSLVAHPHGAIFIRSSIDPVQPPPSTIEWTMVIHNIDWQQQQR